MHKSKLGGFIIDCQTRDLNGAADFWSGALGMPVRELPGTEGDTYKALDDAQHGLDIEVQIVDHPSRVHLDIESDDVDTYYRWIKPRGGMDFVEDFVRPGAEDGLHLDLEHNYPRTVVTDRIAPENLHGLIRKIQFCRGYCG